MSVRSVALTALLGLAALGCPPSSSGMGTSGSPSASASSTAAAPSASASAAPGGKACVGPTGTVKGVIRIVGDEPPNTPFTYPKGCEAAAGTYGKLFRRGQEGQLADAIVTVTEYQNCRVPIAEEAVKLTIKDCAYNTRSVVVTHGQHIEIRNLDPLESYLPHLDGARSPATNVAIPRGPEVKLYTRGHGRYWLRDQMGKEFLMAHVWHLPYATYAVTGLDGRFEIKGVPVGKAKLSVMLPQTRQLLTKNITIEVKEGETVQDVELVFDAAKDTPIDGHGGTKPRDLPAPSASGSSSASAAPSSAPSSSAAAASSSAP